MVATVKASRTVTFRVTVEGVGRHGFGREAQARLFQLSKHPDDCGANPYHWGDLSYEFTSEEDARRQAKYAGWGWLCDSIDQTTLKVYRIEREIRIVTNETEIV